jgi:ketosteroid isomerase-like protein
MLAASSAGADLLARQRYEVHWLHQAEDTVVARLTWRGVIARDAGPFLAGQELTAHIAQFVQVRDGHIVEIDTYDCYEPFGNE